MNTAVTSVPSRPTVTSATDTTRCGVVEIEYGRATNTNQNPRYARQGPWDSYGNVVYKRVRPAP